MGTLRQQVRKNKGSRKDIWGRPTEEGGLLVADVTAMEPQLWPQVGRQWNRTRQLTSFSQAVPPAATNSPKYLGHPWLKMDAHIPYRGSIHLFWAKQLLRMFSYQPEIKEPIVVGDTHERTGHPIHHVDSSTGRSCSLLVIRKSSWNAAACRPWEKEEPSLFT